MAQEDKPVTMIVTVSNVYKHIVAYQYGQLGVTVMYTPVLMIL